MLQFWRQDETPQFAVMERLVKRAKPELADGFIVMKLLQQAEQLGDTGFDQFRLMLMQTWRFSQKAGFAIAEQCSDMIIAGGGPTPSDENMLAGISLAFRLGGLDVAKLRLRSKQEAS